jgi:hypothetical protein
VNEVNMRILNQQAYDRGITDWEMLRGCFGDTRITFTDIDAAAERHGKFLWVETKQPGKDVPMGQLIFLRQLARRGDTVLIVHGTNSTVEDITKITPFGEQVYDSADKDTFRQIVADWFRWADKEKDMPPPFKLAQLLQERMGKDYCDTMMAEWVKMG